MNKYHVLYVEDCTPKVKSFKSKKEAKEFVSNIVSKDEFTQNNMKWVSGIAIGNYCPAKLDYKEKNLLKFLE